MKPLLAKLQAISKIPKTNNLKNFIWVLGFLAFRFVWSLVFGLLDFRRLKNRRDF